MPSDIPTEPETARETARIVEHIERERAWPCPRHPQFIVTQDGECPECGFERDRDEGERSLRREEVVNQTTRHLASVWSVATALCFLGFFALIATIVVAVTTEHDHEHQHQVTVWCYDDPNTNNATSQLVGPPADVIGKC